MSNSPKGLLYSPKFLPDDLHNKLEKWLTSQPESFWVNVSPNPNGRKVKQFGYTYDYNKKGNGDVTDSYPEIILEVVNLIKKCIPEKYILDACIINRYKPGEGITAHIDKIDSFDDYVCCLTMCSGADLEFSKDSDTFTLHTVPNSLYIMTDESRYLWKHQMRGRLTDIVNGTTVKRGIRYSITFRTLLKR